MCYAVVMGFMFALSDLPEVTVAIAQPLVPALALGMSAVLGIEILSYVSLGGIVVSVAGVILYSTNVADISVCFQKRSINQI
jgi:drug/metabolite transporter (DMT)-like permease